MNARERFLRTMRFQEVDRPPWWELWYWDDTVERWYQEGLPQDVHLLDYFGVDRRESVGVNTGLVPAFKETTLEETDKYRIFIDWNGVKRQEFKEHGRATMPLFLEYPIKTRADWEKLKKERLNPNSPRRYPYDWEDRKRMWKERDYPISIHAGSFYGVLRNWIGVENFSLMFYDSPEFVHEMMEYLTEFYIQVIRRAVVEIPDIDYATMWEDMCYKTASLLSPAMFKEFILPCYKKVTSFLIEHGIDIILVDCDGNIEELIPLWLEGGVTGVYPIEVASGMDPVALRKKYGKTLQLLGGIDKRALAQGKQAIDQELETKLPYLCVSGGYVPWCDHLVPPDVSFEHYMYYLNRMKEITLNPKKYLH
ncbi:MAG: hypothetical protein N3A72_03310 [bacterium]|nr:hypothetical protein [bacterium]